MLVQHTRPGLAFNLLSQNNFNTYPVMFSNVFWTWAKPCMVSILGPSELLLFLGCLVEAGQVPQVLKAIFLCFATQTNLNQKKLQLVFIFVFPSCEKSVGGGSLTLNQLVVQDHCQPQKEFQRFIEAALVFLGDQIAPKGTIALGQSSESLGWVQAAKMLSFLL